MVPRFEGNGDKVLFTPVPSFLLAWQEMENDINNAFGGFIASPGAAPGGEGIVLHLETSR